MPLHALVGLADAVSSCFRFRGEDAPSPRQGGQRSAHENVFSRPMPNTGGTGRSMCEKAMRLAASCCPGVVRTKSNKDDPATREELDSAPPIAGDSDTQLEMSTRVRNTRVERQLRSQILTSREKPTRRASIYDEALRGAPAVGDFPLRRAQSLTGGKEGERSKTRPFEPDMLKLRELQTGTSSLTLKWGTPESPRIKNGKSTIKAYECDVKTGKPIVNDTRFSISEGQEASAELTKAVEGLRNGSGPVVWGVDMDGQFIAAPEKEVDGIVDLKDKHGNSIRAVLGHPGLGEEKLRITGELLMMPYEEGHALYDSENPDKKRLVLINKSGRFGREGVRTPENLLNVACLLAKCGVQVDEVIFRKKKDGVVTDTVLLVPRNGHGVPAAALVME